MAALLAPLLFGTVGGAVDLYIYVNHRSELQAVADAAVLAAAKEAGLKGWTEESAKQIVAAVVGSSLTNKFSNATFAQEVIVQQAERRIRLSLSQDHYAYFLLGYFTGSPQIRVQATASASGQTTLCIVVQSTAQSEAFSISGNSRVYAHGCSAYSNSSNTKGLTVKDTSLLRTELACTVGGYKGSTSNFSPLPLTDCPPLSDPLEARALLIDGTINGSCDYSKVKLDGISKSLRPGTYCGGIEISGGAQISLEPGIYVIKDGKLKLDKASSLKGNGVGFVFIGDKTTLEFKNDSIVSLSANVSGAMAGILMYARAPLNKQRDFKIESKDAQKLVGTVYLPGDQLIIGGDKDGDGVCDSDLADDGTIVPAETGAECIADVGTTSSWTAIVVKRLRVTAGSTLVLNSDYGSSTIPVPIGLGPTSATVYLID